ncbi:MAG: cyclic nucleotide-binding domain-containing protein [Terracidiphilus sp.]
MNLDPSAFVADPSLVQALEKQAVPIPCAEDRVLFSQGDDPVGLYVLKSGQVTLTMKSPAGKELVTIQAADGSLLGLPGLIGNEPYTLSAIAHAGAELNFVTRDTFADLMRTDPMLALKVLQVLAAEVRSARNAMLQRSVSKPRRSRLTAPRRA